MGKQTLHKTYLIVLSGMFTALTAAGAFLKIPFYPVPMTLQSFFAILAGGMLPPRYALQSQLAYLLLGLAGLPVFAQGGGLGYIFQPTFGYLLSLPVIAYFISRAFARFPHRTFSQQLWVYLMADLFILFFGVLWLYLSINFGLGKSISYKQALYGGAIIFLPGDVVKSICAALVINTIQKSLLRREE
jgi:biotin transport system substrate-specific component